MNTFLHDLRYGLRMFAKAPGVTLLALLALAFGIGANTAIFSVVNAVLLRPLPYQDTDHLLALSMVYEQQGPGGSPMSASDFLDFKARNDRGFGFAAYSDGTFNYSGAGEPEVIGGAFATADFFSVLGVAPLFGRGFLPDEDKPGSLGVAALSEEFWRTHFNADRNVLGRSITLDGRAYTVVGVMPASFRFPDRKMQVWAAYPIETPARRGPYFLRGLVRFPGTLEHARTELATIAARVKAATPELAANYGYISTPLNEWLVGDVRPALLVLLGAVGLVLLIASLNVANLLLSRAAARAREISIRAALGASRSRIVRQFLTENLLLAFVGGLAGLLLSVWGIDLLRAFGPQNVPRLHEVTVDRVVLAWTALVSLGSGILFGIAPAWQGSRMNLNESLKEGGRGASGSPGARRLRSVLVVSEIAFAMMLLIGAGLLIRSFVRLQQVDPGFHPDQVVTMQVPITRAQYPERPQVFAFYDRLLERVRALPGVRTAAIASSLPPNHLEWSDNYLAEGQPPRDDAHLPIASMLFVSPGYFRSLGIPVLKGRDFTARDKADAPIVTIVSETLARRAFGTTDVVGKRLKVGGTNRPTNPWCEIVGVVADVKYEGLDAPPAPSFYQSALQYSYRETNLVLSSSLDAAALVPSVRSIVHGLDPEIPIAKVGTMRQLVDESVAQQRFRTFLLGVFSAVAMLLAAIGIYGVVAYSVTQRTHEIGIRMALGAQKSDVLRLIVRQGIQLTLIGVGVGLVGAFALTRLTSKLLFGVGATDPATFAGISVLLTLVALLASYIPARQASRTDPMIALSRG